MLKRLRRRGAGQIDLEPENRRIGIKTTQSYRSVLALLKKIDPATKHIVTTQEILVLTEEVADITTLQDSETGETVDASL